MRALTLFTVLVLTGCQSGAAVGTSCGRPSECSSPLTCAFGRCRSACRENRDCGADRLCLLDSTGTGACAVDQDVCADACTGNLVCAGAVCVQSCTSDADCPRDGHCGGAVCVDGASDAGTSLDAGPSDGGASPCTDDRDCQSSQACDIDPSAGSLAVRACRPRCSSGAECPSGSQCIAADYRRDANPGAVGICTPTCDPTNGAGCPAGATCRVRDEGDVTGTTVTIATCALAGTMREGCTGCDGFACGANLSCRYESPGTSRCERMCVLGHDCPDGSPCQADAPMYSASGVAYGWCPPIGCVP